MIRNVLERLVRPPTSATWDASTPNVSTSSSAQASLAPAAHGWGGHPDLQGGSVATHHRRAAGSGLHVHAQDHRRRALVVFDLEQVVDLHNCSPPT